MTETMGVAIGIGVLALVFIYLGCLMWKKEKITLLHSYHYDKVSPSDKKVFCKISGWGVIFIGIGLLVTAIIIGITDSALSFIAVNMVAVYFQTCQPIFLFSKNHSIYFLHLHIIFCSCSGKLSFCIW